LVQVATLIFLAEWGDRSMLATIVLAVSQSPAGQLCEPLIDLACVDPRLCAQAWPTLPKTRMDQCSTRRSG